MTDEQIPPFFAPGYVEPKTGRVTVRAGDYEASDMNGEAPAYWYSAYADSCGLDPWLPVDGINRSTQAEWFDVWLSGGSIRLAGPDCTIFVNATDADKFGV